jgi:hypothetical protein
MDDTPVVLFVLKGSVGVVVCGVHCDISRQLTNTLRCLMQGKATNVCMAAPPLSSTTTPKLSPGCIPSSDFVVRIPDSMCKHVLPIISDARYRQCDCDIEGLVDEIKSSPRSTTPSLSHCLETNIYSWAYRCVVADQAYRNSLAFDKTTDDLYYTSQSSPLWLPPQFRRLRHKQQTRKTSPNTTSRSSSRTSIHQKRRKTCHGQSL